MSTTFQGDKVLDVLEALEGSNADAKRAFGGSKGSLGQGKLERIS